MRTSIIILIISFNISAYSQTDSLAKIDYFGFELLTAEVSAYRAGRLINIEKFNEYSKEANTIILDTRSKAAYDDVHIAGAIHLNFSDFSAWKLAALIPDTNTRILIYCNNNIRSELASLTMKSTPLALNIPTFINLYGYGYKNVYELKDYLNYNDPRLNFVRKAP